MAANELKKTYQNKIILCSICIATYNRNEQLFNLLESLCKLFIEDYINLEILIVDNNPQKEALNVVSKFKDTERIVFRYFSQTIKNISLTRNVALKNATGEFVAFIDDDEIADDNWILKSIETIYRHKADGVFGLVLPVYPKDSPKWSTQRELYFNKEQLTGTKTRATYTTNCVIKLELVKKSNIEFDIDFGLTGGEDIVFFGQLQKLGAKFVYCNEAVTYETVPLHRMKIFSIFYKGLQGGNSFARKTLKIESKKKKCVRMKLLFTGLIGSMLFSTTCLLSFFFSRSIAIRLFRKASNNIGKAMGALNIKYIHYK